MNGKPIQRTIEQERSQAAWSDVQKIGTDRDVARKYRALVKSAPSDIQTNGLAQTVAFWRAKGRAEHKFLFGHVSAWLQQRVTNGEPLHLWIINATTSSNGYRRATVEALAYLGWLKRFAEAEIADSE